MDNSLRSRQINAVVFFAKNTICCGKIKLFKLLYLLDFEHFRQTGQSVTGFEYQAWKFGPVPAPLMEEWEELEPDMAAAVSIEPVQVYDYMRLAIKAKDGVEFDDCDFTPRQLAIMKSLADRFCTALSAPMIDVTHEQNGAWDKVWSDGRGARKPIPYDLAVPDDAPDRAYVLDSAKEARRISPSHADSDY